MNIVNVNTWQIQIQIGLYPQQEVEFVARLLVE